MSMSKNEVCRAARLVLRFSNAREYIIGGARHTTKYNNGLRRRNNELNELTNFFGRRDWGASTVAHFARKVRGTDMWRKTL